MILFQTPTVLDIRAAITLGVSVKKSDNPIGYFGTGLKFAIATLLRTGHTVDIWIEGKPNVFHAKPANIRGEDFQIVCLNGVELGFTTALGRNWTTPMAYRELHSNTMDENGEIFNLGNKQGFEGGPNTTSILVTGPEIVQAYNLRHRLFLSPDKHNPRAPMHRGMFGEIYAAPSNFIYYRGVAAYPLPVPSLTTFNILQESELTEDRTLKSDHNVKYLLATILNSCHSEDVFHDIFDNFKGCFEAQVFDLYPDTILTKTSTATAVLVNRIQTNQPVPDNMVSKVKSLGLSELTPKEIPLNPVQQQYIKAAQELLISMQLIPSAGIPYPIHLTELPNSTIALADRKRLTIYISEKMFEGSTKFVASTLYEEYLHLAKGFDDTSRAMQNHLFETIFTIWENAKGTKI